MPSEESVVRYFLLLLLLLLPTSSSFLFPCFGLFSLSLIILYVNISILSKAFLESGCVSFFFLYTIISYKVLIFCLFLYSHTAAFHCDRAHTNRHPASGTRHRHCHCHCHCRCHCHCHCRCHCHCHWLAAGKRDGAGADALRPCTGA